MGGLPPPLLSRFVCLLLVTSSTPLGQGFPSPDEGVNSENSDLEDKVDVLTNEVKELKDEFHELKGQIGLSEPTPDLVPLEVSRHIFADGQARFTVKFKATAEIRPEMMVLWMRMDTYTPLKEFISNELPTVPPKPDEYSSSVIIGASDTTHLLVTLGTLPTWYQIHIQNSADTSLTQEITSLPIFEIDPPGDLVYESGQNLTMKITAPLEQDPDPSGYNPDNLHVSFNINPIGTDRLLQRYSNGNSAEKFLRFEDEQRFFDHRQLTLVLNTSGTAYSGVMQVTAGQRYPGSLVSRVQIGVQKTLRPSGQQGAFSDGFLAAESQDWIDSDGDGNLLEQCRPNRDCQIVCQFFGNNIRPLQLFRTVDDGETREVVPLSRNTSPYQSFAMEAFRMDESQKVINYTCLGSNDRGHKVTTTFLVFFSDPPTFVKDETTLEVTPDQKVSVTCTAVGSPLPTMSISVDVGGQQTTFNHDDFDVLYQNNDTISVSKVTPLSNVSDSSIQGDYSTYMYVTATCYANNTYGEIEENLYLNPDYVYEYQK